MFPAGSPPAASGLLCEECFEGDDFSAVPNKRPRVRETQPGSLSDIVSVVLDWL